MRVLIVHNRYRSGLPSGENRVVDQEVRALRAAGVTVETYLRSSDEIDTSGVGDRLALAVTPVRGRVAREEVARRIRAARPDVLHLHNPYPLISPRVIDVAVEAGVPVVATVHNYRNVCVRGTYFRDGGPCIDCRGRALPWPAVLHACYRDSRAQSTVMASALAVHRRRWFGVTRFVAVSRQVAAHLSAMGVPAPRIVVKPNPVPDPGPQGPPGKGFLFVGRLDPEKGLDLLLEAWERAGVTGAVLRVVGDGPLRPAVESAARRLPGLEPHGRVGAGEVSRLMRASAAVVVPSVWPETFGLVAVEALAHGRPVVVTRRGALPDVVPADAGWVVEPQPEALAAALRAAAGQDLAGRGRAARRAYREGGYADPLPRLLEVYRAAAAAGAPR